jgi:hypothetical protein
LVSGLLFCLSVQGTYLRAVTIENNVSEHVAVVKQGRTTVTFCQSYLQIDYIMERKITAIAIQKRNRERVNIYLDGEYAFGLARIVAAWLQVGQFLSEEKIVDLQSEDGQESVYL